MWSVGSPAVMEIEKEIDVDVEGRGYPGTQPWLNVGSPAELEIEVEGRGYPDMPTW